MFNILQRLIFVSVLVSIGSCASPVKQASPDQNLRSLIESQAHDLSHDQRLDELTIKEDVSRFQALMKNGGPKAEADWKLHDKLLDIYIRLQAEQKSPQQQITIAAHSRIIYSLPSFCLNSSRAGPSAKERFKWKHGDTGIPYFKEVLGYAKLHAEKQNIIQELLWNLQNKTRWEEYPELHKKILQTIDSKSSDRLPSRLKDQLGQVAEDIVFEHIPGVQSVKEAAAFIEGKFYSFDEFRQHLESHQSSEVTGADAQTLEAIPDTPLYAETESQGFSNQTVTFYNPTDTAVSFDLSDYYLESTKRDVQRIGLSISANPSLMSELEDLLYGGMLRLGIGFTPGLNDVADAYELLVGRDFVSGAPLSLTERALSGLGLIAGSGAGYRYAERSIHSPPKYVNEFEGALEKTSKKAAVHINTVEAKQAYEKANQVNHVTYSAEKANATFPSDWKPLYKSGTQVTEFKTQGSEKWVRLHNDSNQAKRWVIREEAIKGLNPQQIKTKYSLPTVPKYISDVTPSAGTTVRRGRVAENFGGQSGAVQYEILENDILPEWFTNRRLLK